MRVSPTGRRLAFILIALLLGTVRAQAQSVTLAWDRNPETDIAGYTVYVGVTPGSYSSTHDVPGAANTSFTFSQAVPGTRYYFSVAAYNTDNLTGFRSNEVSWKINVAPTLAQPVAPASAVNVAASLQLSANDDGDPLTYTASNLPPGLSINSTTGRISGTPTSSGSRTVNVTVSDGQYSASQSFQWTVNPGLSVPSVTSNVASPQTLGASVTFTAAGSGGVAPYQYKWWLYNGSSWTMLRTWSTSNTYTWTPQSTGSGYLVAAWARSAGSTQDAAEGGTALNQMSFAIVGNGPAPLAVSSFTADRTSPQAVGTTVNFTATATGGSSSRQFKFWIFNGSTWTIGRDWSSTNTYAWAPQAAGSSYLVAVWARNLGSTQDGPEGGTALAQVNYSITGGTAPAPLGVTSVTANRTSPQAVGTTTTFTANATGGTSPRQFKWWVYNGVSWAVGREWTTATTFDWTPQAAGSYVVAAWARNAGSTQDGPEGGTALNQMSFSVTGGTAPGPLVVSSVTANRTSPQAIGTTTTFTANASGGTAPREFKWWVYDGLTWWVRQDWSSSNTFAWTPTLGGSYTVAVWARSAGSVTDGPDSSAAVGTQAFSITGGSGPTPLRLTSMTSNRSAPRPVGSTTVFTAAVSGGTAPYDYKWWVYDGLVWRVMQNWSGNNTFYWTPTSASGAYVVAVWVRSAGNNQDAAENAMCVSSMVFPIVP